SHFIVRLSFPSALSFFLFSVPAPTSIYTLSLHDALPISASYLPNVQYACSRLPPSRFKCSQFLSISAIVSLVGFFLHFAKLTNIVLISPSTHSWVFSKPLFGIQIPFSSRCRISFLRWPE